MTDQPTPAPEYSAPPLGAYSVEEHLKAQQEQTHPGSSEPLHDLPPAEPAAPEPADTATDAPSPEGTPPSE